MLRSVFRLRRAPFRALSALVHHPDAQVRFLVALHLPDCRGLSDDGVVDERGIEPLLVLTADDDADTRYYATVALEDDHPQIDGPRVRAALEARLDDPDEQVRRSATNALATRMARDAR